jgi:hypothetical protein
VLVLYLQQLLHSLSGSSYNLALNIVECKSLRERTNMLWPTLMYLYIGGRLLL